MDLKQHPPILNPSLERKNKSVHLPELDRMSVLFCLMVLFIHTSSYVINVPSEFGIFYHAVFATWKISMSAIYGFIFVSAVKFVLNLRENFSPIRYYWSRAVKIFIPYAVATLVYYLIRITVEGSRFDIKQFALYILNGEASAQLYFIVVLMAFYLLAPLWRWIILRLRGRLVVPIVTVISLIVLIVFPRLTYQDNIFFKCLPFWLAGCYVGRAIKIHGHSVLDRTLARHPLIQWLGFFSVTALYFVYTHHTHASGTKISGILGMIYAAFFVLFVSGIFVRRYRGCRSRSAESAAQYTYFVFLNHCFFVDLINRIIPAHSWTSYLLHLILVPLCSWITAYLLQNAYTYMIIRRVGIKKILLFLLNRVVIVSVLILLQLVLILSIVFYFYDYYLYYYTLIFVICMIVCVYIINTETNPSYKIAWITVVLGFQLFGLLLYLVFHGGTMTKSAREKMLAITEGIKMHLSDDPSCVAEIKDENPDAAVQSSYIRKFANCPLYNNSECAYFSSGEEMFARLFDELENAKHYIFLEFFIIKPGQIFDRLHEIISRKAAEGVDVRIIYDDVGSIRHVSAQMHRQLLAENIKVKSFNPYVPVLSAILNNRDHRKIVSVDGKVAFTGGVNVADEYANIDSPFGYWKDAAVMVRGEAAWSFTVMFLSNWNYLAARKRDSVTDYAAMRPAYISPTTECGYVQPYTDSPLDAENVSENVYLNMINRAQRYIYISTPYLAIGDEMLTAVCNAAKSGVDVRLILPGVPDKRYVNQVAKSYYEVLTRYGVRVYEYTPGFNHAKIFVCDDVYATVGSVNLDFRSMYLSFECGLWLYRSPAIQNIVEDYQSMLSVSSEITHDLVARTKLPTRILRALLRFFSPLM